MAFETFGALKSKFKIENRSRLIRDDVYHRNLVEINLEELAKKYLDIGTVLTIEVPMANLDAFIDIIENGNISNNIDFRQVNENLFEMQYKNINIF